MILGTPASMTPEQCGGGETAGLGERLLSFGGGRLPPADGARSYSGQVTNPDARRRPVRDGEIHGRTRCQRAAGVEALIFRCFAKQPADRFPDAASLEAALERVAQTVPWHGTRSV